MSKIMTAVRWAEQVRAKEQADQGHTTEQPAQTGSRNGTPAQQGTTTPPTSWDQAVEQVKRRLEACEQRVAKREGETVRIKAKLTSSEQLIGYLQQERVVLRQRLEQAADLSTSIEADRTAAYKQLEALHVCQVLTHTIRVAEEELATNAILVAQAAQSQQRVAGEVAHYRQHGGELAQQINQLRSQLAKVVAETGTAQTESGATEEPEGSR